MVTFDELEKFIGGASKILRYSSGAYHLKLKDSSGCWLTLDSNLWVYLNDVAVAELTLGENNLLRDLLNEKVLADATLPVP